MKYATRFGFAVLTLMSAYSAQAAPIQWTSGAGGNDHFYEFVTSNLTWDNARAGALASTFSGMNGYLVTITSAAENAFLLGLSNDGWIGATDSLVEGEWIWADGPEANTMFWLGGIGGSAVGGNYSSWNGGEPNNLGNEDYAHLNNGNWNDLTASHTRSGYFVEYSQAASVPAPATLWLLIPGLIGVFGLRKNGA